MSRNSLAILSLLPLLTGSTAWGLPLGFSDRGGSLIDSKTNLEWLDVILTANRSYEDVSSELASGFGLGGQGWRFATRHEFSVLITNFFGFYYSGGFNDFTPPFGESDSSLVEEFIQIFGDTYDNRLDNDSSVKVDVSPSGAGYVFGYLADNFATHDQFAAQVSDQELVNRADGSWREDNTDLVTNSATAYTLNGNLAVGSWLVRTDGHVAVPEPSTLALLGLVLAGLGWSRRQLTV